MITDVYFCVFYPESCNITANIISNILGSPLLAVVILMAFNLGNAINSYFQVGQITKRKVINSFVSLSLTLLISYFVFFTEKNIYTVTTSEVNLLSRMPANGYYGVDPEKQSDSEDTFGLFSAPSLNQPNFQLFGGASDFSLDWKAQTRTYDLEVRVLDDCIFNKEVISETLSSEPSQLIRNIRNVNLKVSDGQVGMYFISKDGDSDSISVTGDKFVGFTISNSESSGYDLTRFVEESNAIIHSSWHNRISYGITLSNLNVDDSSLKTEYVDRKITISAGDSLIEVKFKVDRKRNLKEKPDCKVLSKSESDAYQLTSLFGGIVFTLQSISNEEFKLEDIQNKNETKIRGASGWLTIDGVEIDDLSEYINNGKLNLIAINSTFDEVFIDSNSHDLLDFKNYISIQNGDLIARVYNEGLLSFKGSSNVIYINGRRANKSRWEKLSFEYKAILISLLALIISFLFRKIMQGLSEDNIYSV